MARASCPAIDQDENASSSLYQPEVISVRSVPNAFAPDPSPCRRMRRPLSRAGARVRRAPSTRCLAVTRRPAWAPNPAQAAVLRPLLHLRQVKHVRNLTVFLLTRAW